MSLRGIKKRVAMFGVNHLFTGTRCFGAKRKLLRMAGHEIGEGTKVVGPIFCTGKMIIGEDCWIGRNLSVEGNGVVRIGDRCDIAPNVAFLTGGHEIGDSNRRAGKGESYSIEVGNGTWIGARATLLGNAHVGDGCVLAACSCVASDIPGNVLAGGVPAKIIRELKNEAEDVTEKQNS